MRSFTLMTALMAAGCLAQPHNKKRDIEWITETEITYQTVWVNPAPAPTPTPSPSPSPSPAPAAVAEPSPSSEAKIGHKPAVQPAPVDPPQAAPALPNHVSAGDSGASSGSDSFETTCVDSHNTIRAQHGAGKLTWDDDLAASAAALANQCNFHHDVTLGPASNYGQNIAMSWGTLGLHSKIAEIKSVILDSWYTDEAQKFSQLGLYGMSNPLDNDFEAWGHFTQEVWKSTTKVGCAVATCAADNGYSTVCNYDPAGNYADEFAANVSN